MSEDFPALGGLTAGSQVAGYLLEEPLGAGGMAVVYRARDERLGRPVALKILAPALAADQEFRQRFTAESRAAAAVDHPHIIPIYEAGQAGRALFIAMRLVTGGDLRQVLAREGPLQPERAAQFLSPVASALDAAHRAGLIHRDVKPANILVDTDLDRPDHVYLSDFGISKGTASSVGLTGTGQYLGTPEYTSPEQINGHTVDGRADQYALACVAWHLLTGTVPFGRDQGLAILLAHLNQPPPSLAERRPGLPAAAGQALARAMAKDPAERYPTCGAFTDALREALALPPYRPTTPKPAATGHSHTGIPAPLAHPATATARAASEPGAPAPAPVPSTPPATADTPTEDIVTPGQLIRRPGPGPDSNPALPARRRRYLMITLAGALAVAATAIPLLLTRPAAPQPPPAAHAATPTASRNKTEPATPPVGTPTAIPTVGGKKTKPATLSRPLTGTLTTTLSDPGGTSSVFAVAFSPGGTLAAGDGDGSTYLWDTTTRKITATLTNPDGEPVYAVAFSPDGTTLAAGDLSGRTYLWDTTTGTLTATLTVPSYSNLVEQSVTSVAFSPDGTTLATADLDGSTYLWDTTTHRLTATLTDPGGYVTSVAFSPDGTILAVGDANDGTYLWDTATHRLTATLTDPGSKGVGGVAFAPHGTTLATSDYNGKTYLWDTATHRLTATLTDAASAYSFGVAFSPDGTTLAIGDYNDRTYLFDTATHRLTATLTDPGGEHVFGVAFSPRGTSLATGGLYHTYLWRISRL